MAFVVTITTTKGNTSDPDWTEWLSSLPDDYLSNQYPDLAGTTALEYCNSYVPSVILNPSEGYVNEEYTYNSETGVGILVTTWENQDSFFASQKREGIYGERPIGLCTGNITTSVDSKIVSGRLTKFTAEVDPGDVLNGPYSGNVVVIGTVASVESDTQFTLVDNAAHAINDRGFSVGNIGSISPMVWLGSTYSNTYPSTSETTYANV